MCYSFISQRRQSGKYLDYYVQKIDYNYDKIINLVMKSNHVDSSLLWIRKWLTMKKKWIMRIKEYLSFMEYIHTNIQIIWYWLNIRTTLKK